MEDFFDFFWRISIERYNSYRTKNELMDIKKKIIISGRRVPDFFANIFLE